MDETLYGMAERLLQLVKDCFRDGGVELPPREVIYTSPIPADCEQVAVLFSGWDTYPGADGPTQCFNMRWLADFSIIVTRKTPAMPKVVRAGATAAAPDPEKMRAAAKISSDDAEALLCVVRTVDEVSNVSLITGSPQGGLQTVELNLQVPVGRL